MRSHSTQVPVIAGFGVLLLLLLSVAAIGVTHIRLISEQLTAIVSERNQKAEFAATMHGLHEARFQALMLAASQPDAFRRDEEMMRYSRMAQDFIQVRDRFLALPLDAEEMALWTVVRGEVRQVEEKAAGISELLASDALDEARRLIKSELASHQERMMQGWDELLDMQRSRNQAALREAEAARKRARGLSIALSATAMLVGVGITLFVIRLSRRLEKNLFEEKERAQVTLQAIGDGVIRFDHSMAVGYLNPAAEVMLGMTARETLNKPVGDILKLFTGEDREDLAMPMGAEVLRGNPVELPPTAKLLTAQAMEFDVEGKCSPIHGPDGGIDRGRSGHARRHRGPGDAAQAGLAGGS
jgi:PAS domain-containing protein